MVPETLTFEELSNGVLLVIDRDVAAPSAALGFFLRVGSRDEGPAEWGAAHFVEHLAFKGAGPWDRMALALEMARLGGDINAYTTRELTCFHAHVLERDLGAAFHLLWALVTAPHFDADAISPERAVVREELSDALDDPEDRVDQAFLEALWGADPVAREVLGSRATLARLGRSRLRSFWETHYRPGALAVVIAGRPDAATEHTIRSLLAGWAPAAPPPPARVEPKPVGGTRRVAMPGDRAHVIVGWPAPPWTDPASSAMRVLAVAFGGQNSSRLWQRIREQEGLAYQVGASYDGQSDHADFTVTATVTPARLDHALTLMGAEWRALADTPLTDDEVERSRTQLEAALVFGLETVEGRMHWHGRSALDRRVPARLDEALTELRRVTPDAVREAASALQHPQVPMAVGLAAPRRTGAVDVAARFQGPLQAAVAPQAPDEPESAQ